MKPISQREAHALRKRVRELEGRELSRFTRWAQDYPGGVNIAVVTLDDVTAAKLKTARALSHAVVAVPQSDNRLYFYALPAPSTAV